MYVRPKIGRISSGGEGAWTSASTEDRGARWIGIDLLQSPKHQKDLVFRPLFACLSALTASTHIIEVAMYSQTIAQSQSRSMSGLLGLGSSHYLLARSDNQSSIPARIDPLNVLAPVDKLGKAPNMWMLRNLSIKNYTQTIIAYRLLSRLLV